MARQCDAGVYRAVGRNNAPENAHEVRLCHEKEALAALPDLKKAQAKRRDPTFKELYDAWLPTHKADESTLGCYRAAIKYFSPIWMMKISDVDIDDLQDCIDECPRGKRTKENMRATCGLMYKYGIPRHLIPENLNLAQFLSVKGEAAAHRPSFTDIEIEKIRQAVGVVPYADYVYCMIYLGFRPSEFLALDVKDYDREQHCLVGGAKTAAGKAVPSPCPRRFRPSSTASLAAAAAARCFAMMLGTPGRCVLLRIAHFIRRSKPPASTIRSWKWLVASNAISTRRTPAATRSPRWPSASKRRKRICWS